MKEGIPCPACGAPTQVIDSRQLEGRILRRRRCRAMSCGSRFSTEERFLAFDARRNRPSTELRTEQTEQRIAAEAQLFAAGIPGGRP